MINSMTGYGRAERVLGKDDHTVSCEIRTVNHRFCEIACRLPRNLFPYEDEIKGMVRDRLDRGYVTLKIAVDESEDMLGALEIDYDYARSYNRLLKRLKKELGLSGDIDVSFFAQRPGVFKESKEASIPDRTWRVIKGAVEDALEDVALSRMREGKRLLADMKKRAKNIESLVGKVEKRSPRTVRNRRKNLLSKIKDLKCTDYSQMRIEEEVAIFAQRSDVVEECVRLRSHLESLLSALAGDGAVGRRIVFLLQEMNREANTIASKAQDAEISGRVVSIKEELERLREQAENVV
jgi:uncharacterized protein (TIGR00255 family)